MSTKSYSLFPSFLKMLIFSALALFVLQARAVGKLWLPESAVASVEVIMPAGEKSPGLDLAKQALINGWQDPENTRIELKLSRDKQLSDQGFSLSPGRITAQTAQGLLYGAYEYLRRQQTGLTLELPFSNPSYQRRLLNHWDNLDGSVERGYAGHSIFWKGRHQPEPTAEDRERWRTYAALNASIGINGAVLNNVNASPEMLSLPVLKRAAAIASELRPYGIVSYLSINFSTPISLAGLKTADPLDPEVIDWWRAKISEIYSLIPDFGGFLVKASSEGLPGPGDFGRSHAEGANMLAGLLKPYQGIVMWRAFVYKPDNSDRAKQAYEEFMPLDGQFSDNVIIQVKNGPIDFQPREPFSPLFGALQKTAVMPELQITQEYLGQEHQLAFLGGLWEECLQSDTWQKGPGSTVARCTDGSLFNQSLTAIAGVSNIGSDSNWCGHPFAAANWYAFGRLAWDNSASASEIAEEWLRLTFKPTQASEKILTSDENPSSDRNPGAEPNRSPKEDPALNHAGEEWEKEFLQPVLSMMLQSREAMVNYMMPLGLHHLFALDHHYGPEPWYEAPGQRKDWTPPYYHQADAKGLGFDRSSGGSNAVAQYREPLRSQFDNAATCPENLLLWFHHLPWDYRLQNGLSLWEELCLRYDAGLQEARRFRLVWDSVESWVDSELFIQVQAKLRRQARDAQVWKDACLLYFQSINQLPFPEEMERPVHDLEALKKISLSEATKGLFLMGVAVNSPQTRGARPAEAEQISKHFNAIVPENCMKSAVIHPEEHRYSFEASDRMVAFGENNAQVITGHCLIWHSQLAPWFCVDEQAKPVSAEVLKSRMREHIFTIMTRYKGRIKGYDVVNEAFEDNGSYRNSPFYQILGKDFIRLAFEYAHQADPEAELYYNDYNMANPAKCDAVVRMVEELKAAGCRIDGVGMQAHVHLDDPSAAAFETSILKLATAGVKVLITEWDISILPNPYRHTGANIADRFAYSDQTDPYRKGVPEEVMKAWEHRVTELFALFLKHHEHIDRITLWGLNDGNSWRNNFPIRGRKDYALLFGRDNQPKAVVQQMIELSLEAKSK